MPIKVESQLFLTKTPLNEINGNILPTSTSFDAKEDRSIDESNDFRVEDFVTKVVKSRDVGDVTGLDSNRPDSVVTLKDNKVNKFCSLHHFESFNFIKFCHNIRFL